MNSAEKMGAREQSALKPCRLEFLLSPLKKEWLISEDKTLTLRTTKEKTPMDEFFTQNSDSASSLDQISLESQPA